MAVIEVSSNVDVLQKIEVVELRDSLGGRLLVQQSLLVMDPNTPDDVLLDWHQATIDDAAFDMEQREKRFLVLVEKRGHDPKKVAAIAALNCKTCADTHK